MNLVIILGNRLNDDTSMTDKLVRRLNKGLEVFQKEFCDYIVVTGGCPNKKAGLTEASQMYAYLLSKGVPEERLVAEDKSNTTFSNAWNTKKLFEDTKIEKIYLVSSKYHFERKYSNCYRIFKRNFRSSEIIKCMAE